MKNNLQRKQLGKKISVFKAAQQEVKPHAGWIKAIRTSLGMSLEQLATKLNISKQSVQSLEKREQEMGITLQSLYDVAAAMDMELVYAIVPKDETLEDLIARKANILAKQIVMRTAQTMALEDQQNSAQRLDEAIEERKQDIILNMPKALWD